MPRRWNGSEWRDEKVEGETTIPRWLGGSFDERWSDESLVELAQRGNQEAFAALVQRYQDRVYNLVLRHVNDEEDALDLTQDTFVKAYSALNKFRGSCAFYTWLYRIAVNLCIDQRRKQRLTLVRFEEIQDERCALEEDEEEQADWMWEGTIGEPERELLAKELREQVRAAVDSLPDRLKMVIILREYEGLSYSEIGRILGCRVGTVKSRLFQAREQLKQKLAPYLG